MLCMSSRKMKILKASSSLVRLVEMRSLKLLRGSKITADGSRIQSKFRTSHKDWDSETQPNDRPIMALIGGIQAPKGRIMGHAGAFVGPNEVDACQKIRKLEQAGVMVTDHPAKFGTTMRDLLVRHARDASVSNMA